MEQVLEHDNNALRESMFLILKLLRSQQGKFPGAYEALVKELVSLSSIYILYLSHI